MKNSKFSIFPIEEINTCGSLMSTLAGQKECVSDLSRELEVSYSRVKGCHLFCPQKFNLLYISGQQLFGQIDRAAYITNYTQKKEKYYVDDYHYTLGALVARIFRWESYSKFPENRKLGSRSDRYRDHPRHLKSTWDHLTPRVSILN